MKKILMLVVLLTGSLFAQYDLGNYAPKDVYKGWLHLPSTNNTITSSLQMVYDGAGNPTGLLLSNDGFGIGSSGVIRDTSFMRWRSVYSRVTFGLNNVNNTSDLDKPISTATQDALDALTDWKGIPAAYSFNGTNNYLTRAFTEKIQAIEMFVYPTATNKTLINFGANLGITFNSSNVIQYGSSFANTSTYINGEAGTTLTLNKWNHVVCLFDEITPTTLDFGKVGSTYFAGLLSFVRPYNRQLTEAEILARYKPAGRPDLFVIDYADKNAGASLITGDNSTFASDTGFWNKPTGATITNGVCTYNSVVTNVNTYKDLFTIGKKYSVTFTIKNYVSGSLTIGIGGNYSSPYSGNGTYTYAALCIDNIYLRLVASGVGDNNTYDIDDITIISNGNVLDLTANNAGRLGWIDQSGNGLNAQTSGSPICLNAENRPNPYRDVKTGIANTATTLSNVIPKGYKITDIQLKGSASLTGVKIGTSSGGQEVVASTTAGTSSTLATLAATANAGYSDSADQTLYVEHGTAGETLDIIIKMEKVAQ